MEAPGQVVNQAICRVRVSDTTEQLEVGAYHDNRSVQALEPWCVLALGVVQAARPEVGGTTPQSLPGRTLDRRKQLGRITVASQEEKARWSDYVVEECRPRPRAHLGLQGQLAPDPIVPQGAAPQGPILMCLLYPVGSDVLQCGVAQGDLVRVSHAEQLADGHGLFDDLGDLLAAFSGVVVEQRFPARSLCQQGQTPRQI